MKWGRCRCVTETYKDKSAAALSCVHVFIKVRPLDRAPANTSYLTVVMAAWSCPSERAGKVGREKPNQTKKNPAFTNVYEAN